MTGTTLRDGLETLFREHDVGVPRFEVYVGAEDRGSAREASTDELSPGLLDDERARIRDRLFRATSDGQRPSEGQLVPLAGPWGERAGERTNDVLSVTFSDNVLADGPFAQVRVEVHNVYDPRTQRFRYSDVPREGASASHPILDYGRALVLEIGYRDSIEPVFEGVVEKTELSFPADDAPKITATAVDKRWRLRANRPEPQSWSASATEETIAADVVAAAGLRLVIGGAAQRTAINGRARRPRDQDLATFLSERARDAVLELSAFGDLVFLLAPSDAAPREALTYRYRAGLISFTPAFNASGCPRAVELRWRDRDRGRTFRGSADVDALVREGLVAEGDPTLTVLLQPPGDGATGESNRVERVTNVAADSDADAERKALALLKRRVDGVFTASGEILGDPRVRAGTTIDVQGVGRYSGLYYLTSTTHTLGEGGYHTSFQARRTRAPVEPSAGGGDS